jgi:hypothetical protein
MEKIKVLADSEIQFHSEFADIIEISNSLSKDISALNKCTIAIFTENTDSILVGYALASKIEIFILGTGLSDITEVFPDITTDWYYDTIIKKAHEEIQIQYDYLKQGA